MLPLFHSSYAKLINLIPRTNIYIFFLIKIRAVNRLKNVITINRMIVMS